MTQSRIYTLNEIIIRRLLPKDLGECFAIDYPSPRTGVPSGMRCGYGCEIRVTGKSYLQANCFLVKSNKKITNMPLTPQDFVGNAIVHEGILEKLLALNLDMTERGWTTCLA